MKRSAYLLLCLFLFNSVLKAQNDTTSNRNSAYSKVYFYRLRNFSGSAIKMKLLVNDIPVVKLRNGSVYKHEIKSGEYRFTCRMVDSSSLKLKIEPGNSYYIKCYFNPGLLSTIPVLEIVDSISGRAVIDGNGLYNQQYKKISMIRPKSRLGIFLGGGFGFDEIPMGTTDNGDKLTLSTGGGFTIGVEYGHEFNKYFDLSFNWLYQGSTLSQKINNGDASFDRMGLIITPALIIPIKGGEFLRIKLGGGLGLYSLGKMAVNSSKAGGGDYVLNYDPAIGFHGSLIFESFFSDKVSFTYGLKYYNIHYKYSTQGSTGISNNSKITSPDGSGLDLFIGFYYHF
jgi:hypothetical protein